jgi:hypothetical protein
VVVAGFVAEDDTRGATDRIARGTVVLERFVVDFALGHVARVRAGPATTTGNVRSHRLQRVLLEKLDRVVVPHALVAEKRLTRWTPVSGIAPASVVAVSTFCGRDLLPAAFACSICTFVPATGIHKWKVERFAQATEINGACFASCSTSPCATTTALYAEAHRTGLMVCNDPE